MCKGPLTPHADDICEQCQRELEQRIEDAKLVRRYVPCGKEKRDIPECRIVRARDMGSVDSVEE